jgi:hypothetical protein
MPDFASEDNACPSLDQLTQPLQVQKAVEVKHLRRDGGPLAEEVVDVVITRPGGERPIATIPPGSNKTWTLWRRGRGTEAGRIRLERQREQPTE